MASKSSGGEFSIHEQESHGMPIVPDSVRDEKIQNHQTLTPYPTEGMDNIAESRSSLMGETEDSLYKTKGGTNEVKADNDGEIAWTLGSNSRLRSVLDSGSTDETEGSAPTGATNEVQVTNDGEIGQSSSSQPVTTDGSSKLVVSSSPAWTLGSNSRLRSVLDSGSTDETEGSAPTGATNEVQVTNDGEIGQCSVSQPVTTDGSSKLVVSLSPVEVTGYPPLTETNSEKSNDLDSIETAEGKEGGRKGSKRKRRKKQTKNITQRVGVTGYQPLPETIEYQKDDLDGTSDDSSDDLEKAEGTGGERKRSRRKRRKKQRVEETGYTPLPETKKYKNDDLDGTGGPTVFTDASSGKEKDKREGRFGGRIGSWWKTSEHFYFLSCPLGENVKDVRVCELIAVYIAILVWGNKWQGKTVTIRCDNQAVVDWLKPDNTSKKLPPAAKHVLSLMKSLAQEYSLEIICDHIPSQNNNIADKLSRSCDKEVKEFTDGMYKNCSKLDMSAQARNGVEGLRTVLQNYQNR